MGVNDISDFSAAVFLNFAEIKTALERPTESVLQSKDCLLKYGQTCDKI